MTMLSTNTTGTATAAEMMVPSTEVTAVGHVFTNSVQVSHITVNLNARKCCQFKLSYRIFIFGITANLQTDIECTPPPPNIQYVLT